jgi:hypothetical protein
MQISNIELCKSSSSSSLSSSSSISSSSSSSSCVPGWVETAGPANYNTWMGTWEGTYYSAGANGNWEVYIVDNGTGVIGGWYPIKIRVTVQPVNLSSPSMLFVRAMDTDDNIIADTGPFAFPSNDPYTVTLTPTYVPTGEGGYYDFEGIRASGGGKEFQLNSVELYEDCDTGSFSSSSSSSSVSSSSTSSSSSSYVPAPLTQGCTQRYNAYDLGYTADGDNTTKFPRIENLGPPGSRTPNNIASMWVEPHGSGVLFGCRFDGCTPLITSVKIDEPGNDIWTSFEHDSTYMYGEDKLVYAVNAASGGINCSFYILDASTMTKLAGITSFDTLGRYPTVWGRENYFTAFSYSNLTGATAGIYKSVWNHLGANIGSKTHIKNNGVRPQNTIVQNGAQLLEDDSKYIMLSFYADYSGLTSSADNRVEGIITTSTGTVVNPEVIVSRNRGTYRDAPGAVAAYKEDDGGSQWGFMVFFWEGPADYQWQFGTLSVRKFSRAGIPITDPNPPTGGIVELINVPSVAPTYGFDTNITVCETYNNKYLVALQNDQSNRYQYMIIDRDLNILVPLTTITTAGPINGTSQSILVLPNFDAVNYYIHGENLNPDPNKDWVVELGEP